MSDNYGESVSVEKYLIYQLGEELFATPLIEIRSVIEYHPAKPIPHTQPYFKGVINIRGEIIGVIDLRERFGIKGATNPDCQLIFDTDGGSLAATVDRVHSVSRLSDPTIERKAGTETQGRGDRAYFMGVGKLDDKLLTLVSLKKVAGSESLSGVNL